MYAPAKKSLGQNFLVDRNIAAKIVAALEVAADEAVLEIGPGRGALTGLLMESGARSVLALEKDRELAASLKERYPELGVVLMDALTFPFETLESSAPIKIIGNLPYNIASPLMWEIVSRAAFERAVFMVQLEVARRLVSEPSTSSYGGLTVWVKSFCRTRLAFKVGPGAFRPRPKVDSAVVLFTPRPEGERPTDPAALNLALKACFQKRRKQLGNILKSQDPQRVAAYFDTSDIDSSIRPENLTPSDFSVLAEMVFASRPGSGEAKEG